MGFKYQKGPERQVDVCMEMNKTKKAAHQPVFQIKFHLYRQIDTKRHGQEVHSAVRKEYVEAFIYGRNKKNRSTYQGIVKMENGELWKKEVNADRVYPEKADFMDILVLFVHLSEIGALSSGDMEKELIFSSDSLLLPLELPLEQPRNYRKKLERLILQARGAAQLERCIFLEKLQKIWDSWREDSDYMVEQYPKELEEELREQVERLKEWEERLKKAEADMNKKTAGVPAYRWNKAMEEYGILY